MYERCLSIRTELKEMKGISSALRKIALTHRAKKNIPLAFIFAKRAWQLSSGIKDKKGIIDSEFMLAELFQIQGENDSAFWYGQRAYLGSKDLDAVADIKRTAAFMKELYKANGMLVEALIASEDLQSAEQRMNDDEVRRMFLKKQYDEKQEQSKQIIIVISIISTLLIGLVFFVFRAYRIKRKSNELITIQKNELEDKNNRIVESITYSQRLQNALLPSLDTIQQVLGKTCITYKAKDIVAGDFYWFKQVDNWTYVAVGDCTGHGVPGALVSMIAINALNQAIGKHDQALPAEILNDCRTEIVRAFGAQDGQIIRDGMDIGLLALNISQEIGYWAGANRLCWFWNGEQWTIFDGDKQSISWSDMPKDFNNLKISNLKPGCRFVMYTDGLSDQFGGEKNKKLGGKRIKSFFYDNEYLDSRKQHHDLEDLWLKWKGDEEQTDDLCLVTFEI
jgi:serine phosphatase RsbU (regulator of sigma subunit)